MKTILIIFIALVLLVIFVPLNGGRILNRSSSTLLSGGMKRKYLLYVPSSYDPEKPTPLVVSMHGFKDYPTRQMRKSGWNNLAERKSFIVVYPLGSGIPPAWQLYDYKNPSANPTKDVRFISDLIDHLQKQYNIDRYRIYANGLSNGGGMSLALACTLSEQIAAIGSVVGAYFYPLDACQPTRPVPMIAFHGTADKLVSYTGGPSERLNYPFPSIPDFMEKLARHNGCTSAPVEQVLNSRVRSTSYYGAADVVLYTIEDGEHAWPVGDRLPRWLAGNASTDIDATHVMWEFFQVHPLNRS
ncbi:MAG: extracellular catalytic domain type 1 short-chain-length polyhydroxyalkanoate depolymerase [Anaerolineaceae bacterium]